MTTFQDPQPQSRRAARQSERADIAEPAVGVYSEQPQPTGEPLDYVTQQKPPIPSYDGPSFRPRGTTPQPADELPPTQALPKIEQPSFRRRDFSPEGRRSAAASTSWAPSADADPGVDISYQTEARAPAPVAELPPTIAPAPVTHVVESVPLVSELPRSVATEHTLTRRELRAMLQAETAQAPELVEPVPPAPLAVSPAAPADDQTSWPFGSLAPEAPVAEPVAADLAPVFQSAPSPAPSPELTDAIAEFDWLTAEKPEPIETQTVAEPAAESAQWTPPPGHWSSQLDAETSEPIESTINRTVGSGSAATSALVLPDIPVGDIRGPLTGTGEIMLTGSIDLPQSYSSTGASARLEHEGIDRFFESHDAELVSTDSAPVSAIKAVSTHSGSNLHQAPKPKGTRALTALVIAAASMGVVVVGLLIVAFAIGGF